MSSQVVGGIIVLVVILGYIALNFLAGGYIANLIASRFSKDTDDEVLQIEEDRGMGMSTWNTVTRGEQRARYWAFLVVYPLFGYLNYKLWDQVTATLQFVASTLGKLVTSFL